MFSQATLEKLTNSAIMKISLPFFALLSILMFSETIAARTVPGEGMKEKLMAERMKPAVTGKPFVSDFKPSENMFFYYSNQASSSEKPAETGKPFVYGFKPSENYLYKYSGSNQASLSEKPAVIGKSFVYDFKPSENYLYKYSGSDQVSSS